jgi:DNA-directed RNA polymerase subunit beta'
MGLLLDITPRVWKKFFIWFLYRHGPGIYTSPEKPLLTEKEYRDMREKYEDDFDAGMGAEPLRTSYGYRLCSASKELRNDLNPPEVRKKPSLSNGLRLSRRFLTSATSLSG